MFHSINRKEFTNGQCGKQSWLWFSDASPTRNSMCDKKHWGFRFLGPLFVLDNLFPGNMVNYLFLMLIYGLANRNGDREAGMPKHEFLE